MAPATLSVALCTADAAGSLPDQLESIVAQARLPDELVIADDGSTDGTVGILQAFIPEAPFPVRLYRNPRRSAPPRAWSGHWRCAGAT